MSSRFAAHIRHRLISRSFDTIATFPAPIFAEVITEKKDQALIAIALDSMKKTGYKFFDGYLTLAFVFVFEINVNFVNDLLAKIPRLIPPPPHC